MKSQAPANKRLASIAQDFAQTIEEMIA